MLQSLYCINRPAECIFWRGGCFLPAGTPRGGVQIPENSAFRSPRVWERAHKTALKALILSSQRLKSRSFLQDAAHGACLSPKIQYQAPSAAENSQKCTAPPALGTRSKKSNSLGEHVNAGPSDPDRRFRLATFDGVKGGAKSKYVGRGRRARWDGFRPRLFVAEADAQRLGLAYQVALGIDKLELAGDLLERHVAHLAVTQGNHVAKLAA